MRDYKSSYKSKMILNFILLGLCIGFGIFYGIVTILGILEHYGIIHNVWEITNFSWVNIILAFVIIFCLIFFPIRTIIKNVKNYKHISNISNNVAEEYNKKTEKIKESLDNKGIKNEITVDEKNNSLSREEIEKKDFKAPYFAKKHRLKYFVISYIGLLFLYIVGICMLINPNGNNNYGLICIIMATVYLTISIPKVLAEFKGKEEIGILVEIGYTQFAHGRRKHAVVAFKGKLIEVSLPFDNSEYNKWDYSKGIELLEKHIGKEIPLKVYKNSVIINFKKMYWE